MAILVSTMNDVPGYRVKRRHIRRSKVGKRQRLTPEETIAFMKETFGTEVIG